MNKKLKKSIACFVVVLCLLITPIVFVGCNKKEKLQTGATIYGVECKFDGVQVERGNDTLQNGSHSSATGEGRFDYRLCFAREYNLSINLAAFNTKDIDWSANTRFFKIVSHNNKVTFVDGKFENTTTYVVEEENEEILTLKSNTLDSVKINLKIKADGAFTYHSDTDLGTNWAEVLLEEKKSSMVTDEQLDGTKFSIYLADKLITEFRVDVGESLVEDIVSEIN